MYIAFIIAGIILIAVGLGIIVLGEKQFAPESRLAMLCSEKVPAIVSDYIEETERVYRSDGPGKKTLHFYTPVFKYGYDGQVYQQEYHRRLEAKLYHVGQQTTIYINPNQPRTIYDPNDKTKSFVLILFKAIGVFFIIMGIGLIVFLILGLMLTNLMSKSVLV